VSADTSPPLGRFIREQRLLARMSVREMARMANISNAYLSQVERGMHEPSIRVLKALAGVLEIPVENLLRFGGGGHLDATTEGAGIDAGVEHAITRDPRLSDTQRRTLLEIYRSFAQSD
jgi:transcriptional regulator with XRE-family HTH domain